MTVKYIYLYQREETIIFQLQKKRYLKCIKVDVEIPRKSSQFIESPHHVILNTNLT